MSWGLTAGAAADVYYVALLRFLGCTADAPEMAHYAGGDNIALIAAMAPVYMGSTGEAVRTLARSVGRGASLPRRAWLLAEALRDSRSVVSHCEVGPRLAARLGLGDGVVDALAHAYERWDGRGLPDGLAGEAVPVAVRVVVVARDAVLWQRLAGTDAALRGAARRRGRAYDPAVVDAVRAVGMPGADDRSVWEDVLAAEPAPVRRIGAVALDRALAAVGDFADLRSRWTRGRSTRRRRDRRGRPGGPAGCRPTTSPRCVVRRWSPTSARWACRPGSGRSRTARGGGHRAGPAAPVPVRAGPGPLPRAAAGGRARRGPPRTARRLRLPPRLDRRAAAEPGAAARRRRRVDGAAARTGRTAPRTPPAEARDVLWAEVTRGPARRRPRSRRCSPRRPRRRRTGGPPRPAGLSEREVEVLRLIARGHSNREVAARLSISAKTVGHHVGHIYAKIGVTTRPAAALFAMEHDLLRE